MLPAHLFGGPSLKSEALSGPIAAGEPAPSVSPATQVRTAASVKAALGTQWHRRDLAVTLEQPDRWLAAVIRPFPFGTWLAVHQALMILLTPVNRSKCTRAIGGFVLLVLSACGSSSEKVDKGTDQSSGGRSFTGGGGTDRTGAGGAEEDDSATGSQPSGGFESAGAAGGSESGGASSGGSGGVGSGGVGGIIPAAGGAFVSVEDLSLSERLVPFQDWRKPGASVTGILLAAGSEIYSTAVMWNQEPAFHQSDGTYTFSYEGSSPYAIYFPSMGEGENYLEDWNVTLGDGEVVQYDAAAFGPHTENAWGLYRDAYIATVEVNDGRGSDGQVTFVVTDVTILDETEEVPMRSIDVITEASEDFNGELAGAQASIDALFSSARAETEAPPAIDFDTSEPRQGVWPNLELEAGTLTLTFLFQQSESWSQSRGFDSGTEGTPPMEIFESHYYLVEFASVYRYALDGALLDKTVYPAELDR